jgi:flagellar assembly factor FliW
MTAAAPTESLTIPTRLFGPLTVRPELCVRFPDGLLGFAGERRFVLLPAAADGVYWLQSVEEPGLAFLVADPFPAYPGYAVDLEDDDPALGAATPPLVLAIVTLPRPGVPGGATANLRGPLVIDLEGRTGRQLVLADVPWSTQEPYALPAQPTGGTR